MQVVYQKEHETESIKNQVDDYQSLETDELVMLSFVIDKRMTWEKQLHALTVQLNQESPGV